MDDAIAGLDVKLNDLGRGLRRANRHAFAKDVVDCSLDSQGSSIKCFKGCRAVRNPEGNDNIKLCHNLRTIPDCFVGHQVPLEDTRERIWVLQQPVKGLVANLGKGAVGRGEEGEGGSSVQDVGGGAVVEGSSEGGQAEPHCRMATLLQAPANASSLPKSRWRYGEASEPSNDTRGY